jgi:hypothetical protein
MREQGSRAPSVLTLCKRAVDESGDRVRGGALGRLDLVTRVEVDGRRDARVTEPPADEFEVHVPSRASVAARVRVVQAHVREPRPLPPHLERLRERPRVQRLAFQRLKTRSRSTAGEPTT